MFLNTPEVQELLRLKSSRSTMAVK